MEITNLSPVGSTYYECENCLTRVKHIKIADEEGNISYFCCLCGRKKVVKNDG